MKVRDLLLALFTGLLLVLLVPLLVCVFRTYVYFPKPVQVEPCQPSQSHKPVAHSDAIIRRFSEALKFKTVTRGIGKYDKDELLRFIKFIETSFPRIHSSPLVKLEKIANYSLLYTIKGKNPSLKPYMLVSHLDVVPVEPEKWDVDPFGGVIKDGYVIGRGAIDVKDTLMGSLEALEALLATNYEPERTFYMAFGHDEEGHGDEGAQTIAKTFLDRGVELEYILDEGTMIMKSMFPGVENPVASIAVTEKGFATFKIEVHGEPGHSSMPQGETTIVTLSKAISKLDAAALPSRFGRGPEKALLEALAPYASFPFNVVYSNLWLFAPLVSWFISKQGAGNALARTTTAATVIKGGTKENVLPSYCAAIVNHRLHPSDRVADILELDLQIINDERVSITPHQGSVFEPHPISPYGEDAFGFNIIGHSIRTVFPDAIVAPGIMVASTDSKWYLNLTNNIYRFTPPVLNHEQLKMFHGHNEKLAADNFIKIVNFFHHLIPLSDRATLPKRSGKDEL